MSCWKRYQTVLLRVDGVVDLDHDQVFAVAVGQRLLPLIGAAAPVEQIAARLRAGQQRPARVQRAGTHRNRSPGGVAEEAEHRLVETQSRRARPAARSP